MPTGMNAREREAKEKNLLLMQGCYSFWEGGGNLLHLSGVPNLMRSNQLKPLMEV
jgi:hypothetical protein